MRNELSQENKSLRETRIIKRLKDNTPVARFHVTPEEVLILLEDPIRLSVETPPFKSFFINRILQGMINKDLLIRLIKDNCPKLK
ncbi:MAG: hypothetical protein P0116_08820 [Candidatus Nitrosocosmicus sp.]|nr:hypothetical protein [Candidatus Nitrosocosmicus sp.]